MQSAFEKEILLLLDRIRAWLAAHDRGVLIALFFSVSPIPPLPIVGLFLSVFNYRLYKQHKLSSGEGGLIQLSLIFSLISSVGSIWLAFVVFQFFNQSLYEIGDIFPRLWEILTYLTRRAIESTPFNKPGSVTI